MLGTIKKSNRYQYTCPDVINYRRNQRRLVYVSYALSCIPPLLLWLALLPSDKDTDPETTVNPDTDTPVENQD